MENNQNEVRTTTTELQNFFAEDLKRKTKGREDMLGLIRESCNFQKALQEFITRNNNATNSEASLSFITFSANPEQDSFISIEVKAEFKGKVGYSAKGVLYCQFPSEALPFKIYQEGNDFLDNEVGFTACSESIESESWNAPRIVLKDDIGYGAFSLAEITGFASPTIVLKLEN